MSYPWVRRLVIGKKIEVVEPIQTVKAHLLLDTEVVKVITMEGLRLDEDGECYPIDAHRAMLDYLYSRDFYATDDGVLIPSHRVDEISFHIETNMRRFWTRR